MLWRGSVPYGRISIWSYTYPIYTYTYLYLSYHSIWSFNQHTAWAEYKLPTCATLGRWLTSMSLSFFICKMGEIEFMCVQ